MAKPTDEEIAAAVMAMSEVIPFFPQTPTGKDIVFQSLKSFVGEKQGLQWLVSTAIRVITKKVGFSIAELRNLYTTRWPAIDGLPVCGSDIPGFTPAEAMDEAEMRYLIREAEQTDRKLLAWKREAKLLGAAPDPDPPKLLEGTVEHVQMPVETGPRHTPQWLSDLMAPVGGAKEEIDLRPLKQVESEVAALPKMHTRTPQETERLIEEIKRAVLQRAKTTGAVQ